MAGYAMGYDDGGAIPDDNSGALPVAGPDPEADNSGALPVAQSDQPQQQPQQEDQSRSGINFNAGDVPGNAKRIIQYLLGAGAAHPEVANKFATAVKLEHPGTSDDDANLLSVLKAKEKGGDEAASALMQSHMQQYNAANALAYAAATGTDGKPADPNAAAKSATRASQHMLDGSTTTFSVDPHGNGFTAAVTTVDGKHQNFALTPQQFASFVKPGGAGQWDRVLSGHGNMASALANLTQASASSNADTSGQNGGKSASADNSSATPIDGESDTTSAYRRGDYDQFLRDSGKGKFAANQQSADDVDEAKDNAKLDAQSRKMFPWMSQERQRQQWIAQQQSEAAGRQNKIDVEKEKGTFRVQTEGEKNKGRMYGADRRATSNENVAHTKADAARDVAKTRGDASIEAAKQRAITDAAKQASISQREDDRRRAKLFATLVNSANITSQADIDRAAKTAGITLNQPATGGPAQAQPVRQAQPVPQGAPTQGQRPSGVPAGAKLYQGKWYVRGPNGEAVPAPGQQ